MAQVQLSTKLNLDTWNKLDELVKQLDQSKASIVDQAISDLHTKTIKKDKKNPGSAATFPAAERID
jgi:predicted transcriptional regulator